MNVDKEKYKFQEPRFYQKNIAKLGDFRAGFNYEQV